MTRISYFNPPVKNIKPNATMSLGVILRNIKGDEYKRDTQGYRSIPYDYDRYRKALYKTTSFPCVAFSGEFKKRNDDSIIKHSSIVAIHIDLDPTRIHIVKMFIKLLRFDNPIIFAFVSPSGNGLNVGIRVDNENYSQKENYEAGINYLKRHASIPNNRFDRSYSNVSHLFFLCHDENIFINKKVRGSDISEVSVLDTAEWLHPKEIVVIENEEIQRESKSKES